ncbi:uncharacterized protein I206_100954 [Kwoniella pini CBS 10737]|uniref:Uncharacterized protein n=1 Tax=Kwoniella pini CBS 10737 TaxID=1296096 RepID=A0A1B9ICF1_9TREE|nr:uncharacterized protein I206_00372 [Kwoniella pini CBS 10737]OCF53071.1 hypothetical protein I206_00372 [Kwoniella pini CBS 10737]
MLLKLRHFRSCQGINGGPLSLKSFSTAKPSSFGQPKLIKQYSAIGLGSLVLSGVSYYYFFDHKYKNITLFDGDAAKIRTIPAKAVELNYTSDSAEGAKTHTHSHLLLSEEEVENKIKAGAADVKMNRENNPVRKWEVNSLPSVETLGEDRYSIDIILKADLANLVNGEEPFWKKWWNTRTQLHPRKEGEEVVLI